MKKLLVVVDMQNDFVTGPLGTPEAREIVPCVRELAERAEHVVYTADTHSEEYLSTREGRFLPIKHCIMRTEGWKIDERVYLAGAPIIEKPTFGSFDLVEFIRQGGYSDITFCGVCTDICVVSNALLVKAAFPEAEIRVVERACAGVSPERHRAAIETMKSCQIVIE